MQVIRRTECLGLKLTRTVAALGSFDGVHLGHQAIVREVEMRAGTVSQQSAVVTFSPHPRELLSPDRSPLLLTSLEEKQELLARLGIDVLAVLDFTLAMAEMTPDEFARGILVEWLRVSAVVVGYNFGFGKGRSGHVGTLRELGGRYGFKVDSIPPVRLSGSVVSSTRIRRLLLAGKVEAARDLLGRAYAIEGWVVRGDGRGKHLGYPTANLKTTDRSKLIPGPGVYAVQAEVEGKTRAAMLNIGRRPTFAVPEKTAPILEVHLLDYDADLYGQRVRVVFRSRLRDEAAFDSADDLRQQLVRDEQTVRRLFLNGRQV